MRLLLVLYRGSEKVRVMLGLAAMLLLPRLGVMLGSDRPLWVPSV